MLAGRPGARSAAAGLTAESSDTRGRAPLSPRESGGRHRPGAYLDMKIQLEKNLEEERQILLQQQKLCRNRARKYFVESNRRKKAFEEKRKEQEEREHQIREQILQQRKQKFEEVTEKFQRAHIPLSQRRAAFQKTVPPLEEALKQIQESNLKSEVNPPFSHKPTINWRSTPACPAISSPDPYLPGQLSPSRAPLLSHHSQILPSYPTVSPIRQPHSLPIHPPIPSALPKTSLPAPLLAYPIKYLPRPPAPITSSFSSTFPRLPAPVSSGPPDHLPHPPQSSPVIPDPDPQNKLFYKTFRPKHFLPAQRSTPATLMPTLVRRSLPARLVVSPAPLEALPVLKPSCLSSHPLHQPLPTLSYNTALPKHPASLDPSQSVQQSVPQTTALSNQPQVFVDHPPASTPAHPPLCHSPSSSLSSSPSTSASSSSPSRVFSSSSSFLSSSSPSTTSPSLHPSSVPLYPSPLHSSSSPCLPPTYFAFPSPISPVSSSFPPILLSPFISTSPAPFIPIHPFNPPHWGKKVEKRREESGVEKKRIEKKKLRDDNFKEL